MSHPPDMRATPTPGPSDAALRPPGDPGTTQQCAHCGRTSHGFACCGPLAQSRGERCTIDHRATRTQPPPLPRLGEVIRDAERLCAQLINLLGRDYDPKSALNVEAFPGEQLADVRLAMLRADVQQVLRGLGDLADLRHPPAGSAVPVYLPDRPAPPRPPGERPLPPGLAAADPEPAAACESQHGPPSVAAGANVDLFVNEASNRRPQ